MGRPMMHRKVKHNRLREAGVADHLAGGHDHRPATAVSAAILAAEPPKAAAADSSDSVKTTEQSRAERRLAIRAEIDAMFAELEKLE